MNEKRPGRYRGKGGKTEVQLVVAWALKTFYFTLRYSRLTMLGWLQVQLHIRVHLSFFKFSSPLGEDRVWSRGPCVMQEACVGFSCPGVWPVAGSRVNTTLDNEMTRLIRSLGGLWLLLFTTPSISFESRLGLRFDLSHHSEHDQSTCWL